MSITCLLLSAAALGLAAATPVPDCGAGSSRAEAAICANAELKAADDAVATRYREALARLVGEPHDNLVADQREWIAARETRCKDRKADADHAACLMRQTRERADFLAATPASGPGLERPLTPFVARQALTADKCSGEVSVHFFAEPRTAGETAFNDTIMGKASALMAEAGERPADAPGHFKCDYAIASRVTYAAPDRVSAALAVYVYGGGAHGNYYEEAVTVDLKTGATPRFEALFPEAARDELAKVCAAGLIDEKARRYAEDGSDAAQARKAAEESVAGQMGAVERGLGDMTRWMIYADRAEIYFPPYEMGPYAEGAYSCALPAETLRRLAAPSAWLVP